MSVTKNIARKVVFPFIQTFGIEKLVSSMGSNKTLNIMYHGVVKNDSNYFSARHLLDKQFEQHLTYFKKNFNIISLEQAFENIKQGIIPSKKTITISFDDGYLNNFTTALPILEKHQIPATFFISSVCLTPMPVQTLWADLISFMNLKYSSYEAGNIKITKGRVENFNQSIFEYIKERNPKERDGILDELIREYKIAETITEIPAEVWKLMNKTELVEFSKHPLITIGSHGHNHYNLANIPIEDAKNDLITSKELLEKELKTEINMVAYPDGSYNDEIKNMAENLGYKYQIAVNYKEKSDYSDNRILNRHGISSTTTFESSMFFTHLALRKKGF